MRIKLLTLVFISSAICNSVACQTAEVSVDYMWKVTSLNNPNAGKTPIQRIYKVDGKTVRTETDSVEVNEILKRISFERFIRVEVYKACSFTTFSNSNENDGIRMNSPDTVIYCNKQWLSVTNERQDPILLKHLKLDSTQEHKMILGYDCVKVIATSTDNGEKYIIWCTDKLPPQLLPITGFQEFGQGILEATDAINTWSIVAQEIRLASK